MDRYYDLVREPIITEQSFRLIEDHNRYTFKVDVKANKVEIKKAIEAIFDVVVIKVNTINVKPKFKKMGQHEGYTAAYKKAIVELKEGQTIEAFNI
ncbi:MAG TPA: 50S ribosomal protein L23 [Acholeplasmataceae bacterium]|nr:50S ribosomal protein L23 [Acholeplasmataceae bacterium]